MQHTAQYQSLDRLAQPNKSRRAEMLALVAVALSLSLAACGRDARAPSGSSDVLDANTVHFMVAPTSKARDEVQRAREAVDAGQGQLEAARDALQEADRALAELQLFYLPTTEARGQLLTAYHEDLSGNQEARDAALAQARTHLVQVAENNGTGVRTVVEDILRALTDIRIRADRSAPVDEQLDTVCRQVENLLLRGELILRTDEANTPSPTPAHKP